MVGGADGDQDADQRCQYRQRLMYCRPHKGKHHRQEYGEDDPIQDNPQLAWVLGQRNPQKAHDPVNGQVGDGPRRDDPEWGASPV